MIKKKKKRYSELGRYVRVWREGMKIDRKDLLEFALKSNSDTFDTNRTYTKSQIQSLVSRYIKYNCTKNKTKNKRQKEQKHTQEIDENPPEQKEEQDQAHGGDNDQHDDIMRDETTQNKTNDSENQGSQKTSDTIEKAAKRNQKSNEVFKQLLRRLQEQEKDRQKQNESRLSQNVSRNIRYGGGGAKMSDAKDADIATFRLIQTLLLKLASETSPVGKEEGNRKWDPVKLIKSRFNADFNNAKFSRPPEKRIWFIVDNSGSVSRFAKFIVSMIQGASNIVNVIMGSEAKPICLLKLPKVNKPKLLTFRDLFSFASWKQEFDYSFLVCLKTFLKECKVRKGDILVFWGDLMDALESDKDTPQLLRRTLRNYKNYFLLSHDGTKYYHGNHTHIIKESNVFEMFYNVHDAITLRNVIKRIK